MQHIMLNIGLQNVKALLSNSLLLDSN